METTNEAKKVVVAGLSNMYSDYITTPEEYEVFIKVTKTFNNSIEKINRNDNRHVTNLARLGHQKREG